MTKQQKSLRKGCYFDLVLASWSCFLLSDFMSVICSSAPPPPPHTTNMHTAYIHTDAQRQSNGFSKNVGEQLALFVELVSYYEITSLMEGKSIHWSHPALRSASLL